MIKENSGIRKEDIINRRMFIIGAAKILVFIGIIGRLFSLQILQRNGHSFQSYLEGNYDYLQYRIVGR